MSENNPKTVFTLDAGYRLRELIQKLQEIEGEQGDINVSMLVRYFGKDPLIVGDDIEGRIERVTVYHGELHLTGNARKA